MYSNYVIYKAIIENNEEKLLIDEITHLYNKVKDDEMFIFQNSFNEKKDKIDSFIREWNNYFLEEELKILIKMSSYFDGYKIYIYF
ncbi:hypothetical protein [Spiroplasma endosymbiont of Nebria brevicollis]|uniref:hypothetical protein n=1 Tax=Spiroplasma endosymbiont of Nebria brevicollis TaxID=3066284 RepID=UPI00313D6837